MARIATPRGALARRERLLREVPDGLAAQEQRLFAEAKRAEAAGDRARAEALFGASRKAFHAAEGIRRAVRDGGDVDHALEDAHRLWVKLRELPA